MMLTYKFTQKSQETYTIFDTLCKKKNYRLHKMD